MKIAAGVLFIALCYSILVLFIESYWAWGLFQICICLLTASFALWAPNPRPPAWTLALAAAAAWPVFQLVMGTTLSRERTSEQALNWFTFLALFAFSAVLLRDRDALRGLLRSVCLFGMLVAVVGTIQSYSSGGKIFWCFESGFPNEVIGPFVNRNQFAAWIELLLPGAIYLAVAEKRLRALYASAAASMFGAVIASASRTGFVLICGEIAAVGIAITMRGSASKRLFLLRAAQTAALGLTATFIAGWQSLEARLSNSEPEVLRVDAARASVRMIHDRPWAGSGLGTWPILYPRYATVDKGVAVNQAHNDWLQWASEGGLPFVILLGVFSVFLFKRAILSIYGIGTIVFLLHAFVDYPMQQRPALAAWFFFMAGAAAAQPDGWKRGRSWIITRNWA
jgi:O-antigen ligase